MCIGILHLLFMVQAAERKPKTNEVTYVRDQFKSSSKKKKKKKKKRKETERES